MDYLKDKFKFHRCSELMLTELTRIVHSFMIGFNQRWKACHRNKKNFLNKYNDWLNTNILIENFDLPSTSGSSTKKPGRPKKDFASSGMKSKTRKVKSLVTENTLSELTHATNIKLRRSGRRDAASMLEELISTPKRASKVKRAYKGAPKKIPTYTPEEALALITSANLSYRKYQLIRKSAIEKGLKVYPSYHNIQIAKKECYPPDEDCIINESLAEIKLQSLVDLTIKRLFIVQHEVLNSMFSEEMMTLRNIAIIFKWGCDGSGGQSRYKQKASTGEFEDANILTTSLVPLQLHGFNKMNQVIIWKNPRPSSTSFCRPIRFRFVKETDNSIIEEFENVRNQIATIQPTSVEFNGHTLQVTHQFEETMVDGKVCNILASNKATQKCYICHATSKDMNNLNLIRQRPCDPQTFSFGLSTLHAQIRLMECVLHIAYRLEVQKWQCRKTEEKQNVAARKLTIINRFRTETGLLLDTPKQGGGNTNDGNSARRFFKNTRVSSEITGIDESLIKRFYVILRTLTCGYDINVDTFKKYCEETANLYVSLYNWYPMPVTLHKILLHGPTVIEHFLLPIGQMSEEALEARHKEFRKFRLEHSRKISRTKTNPDILHSLLISSDPLITSLKQHEKSKETVIDPEVLKLIKAPTIHTTPTQMQENDSDSSNRESCSDSEGSSNISE